jgi:hypothetical protein
MTMKVSYVIAALICALGFGLIIWGTASTDAVTLLGATFHPRLAKGVGVFGMIAGVITFLGLFGASLPPRPAGRRG